MQLSDYKVMRIPKASGGWRVILEPNPELKEKQRKVLKWLMARRISPGPYAHAFVRYRSIKTHTSRHVGKKVIVRMDVKDFFPSITTPMILAALIREGVSKEHAERIVELCTVDDRLPQGAPTSPFLANVVFKSLDFRLAGLARKFCQQRFQTSYSRYADDLIFSSNDEKLHIIIHAVRKILESAGFLVNHKKTRVYRNGNRQIITGIVVNKFPNIPRKESRKFRAKLHNIKKAIIKRTHDVIDWAQIQGKAAYYNQINPVLGQRFLKEIGELQLLAKLTNTPT